MNKWNYMLIVLLGGCCYGILSTFVKLAYAAGYSVTEVIGGQYLFGAVMIWFLVFITGKKRITRNQIIKLILSGIPFGLTGGFYYQSLQTLHASLAIIFLFQFIWMGSLLERVFYKKKPSKEKWISIVLLLVGSLFAGGLLSEGGIHLTLEGTIWGLLSALTFATFIFLSGSVGKDTQPLLKSALLTTGGLLTVSIMFPPIYLLDLPILMGVAPYGIVLGLFGAVLPPLLFSIGMPRIGSGLGTILTASELPVAVFMSAFILNEQVSSSQWAGVMLILTGIVISQVRLSRVPGTLKRQNV